MTNNTATDWQSIGDWKDGRVHSGAKTMIWITLLFGIAFTGISLPAVLAIPEEYAKGNHAILVTLLFPLVGISSLAWCAYSVLSWRKFGATELVLNPAPGSIGGDFGGYIDIPVAWHNDTIVNITLNCQKTTTSGSGKNRSTRTKILWQREGIATLSPAANGTRCAFRFSIPDDLPESEKSSSNYRHWSLQMDCDLPGIDYNRSFSVPVFKTDEPQRSTLKADYAKESAPLSKAPEGTVRITETPNGLQFYYPWHRHLWLGIMMLITGSIFAGSGYFISTKDDTFIFPVVFGGVGTLLALIGLYVIGNTLTTTVSSSGINVVRNVYGFRFQRNVKKENIVNLKREIKSQINGGTTNRVFYSIIAHTKDKRKITIADTLEGSRAADFVEKRILTALKLNDSQSDLLDTWSS